jgi:hypothetical protein
MGIAHVLLRSAGSRWLAVGCMVGWPLRPVYRSGRGGQGGIFLVGWRTWTCCECEGGLYGLVCVVRVALIVLNVLVKVHGCEDVHRGVVLVCYVRVAMQSSICNFFDKCMTWFAD